jgi:hypothetical protein
MSLSLRQSETLPQRCSQRGRPQGQHSIVGDERSSVEKGWGPALGQTSARKMKGDISSMGDGNDFECAAGCALLGTQHELSPIMN